MNPSQLSKAQSAWLNQLFAIRGHIHINPFYQCCVPVADCLETGLFTHRTNLPIDPPSDSFQQFDCNYVIEHECAVEACFLKQFRYHVYDYPERNRNYRGLVCYDVEFDGKTVCIDGNSSYNLEVNWDDPDDEDEPQVLERDKDKVPDSKEWFGQREYKFGPHSAWIAPGLALSAAAHPDRSLVYADMPELARAFEPMMFGGSFHPIRTLQSWLLQQELLYPQRRPLKLSFYAVERV